MKKLDGKNKRVLLIGGGLVAVVLAVVWIIRNRQSQASGTGTGAQFASLGPNLSGGSYGYTPGASSLPIPPADSIPAAIPGGGWFYKLLRSGETNGPVVRGSAPPDPYADQFRGAVWNPSIDYPFPVRDPGPAFIGPPVSDDTGSGVYGGAFKFGPNPFIGVKPIGDSYAIGAPSTPDALPIAFGAGAPVGASEVITRIASGAGFKSATPADVFTR